MKIKKQMITVENFAVVLWIFAITIFFAVFFRYGYISFEQNDDMFISTIPSGIYGSYYIHTCFSNILQGIFLAGLSRFMPVCNWMIMLYMGYIYISYIGIGVWLTKIKGALLGGGLSALFFLTTYPSLIHNMNFSKTGGVLIGVGVVIFAYHTEKISEKKNVVWLLISGSMIFAGALIRKDSIIAALPFVLLLIIDTALKCKSRGLKWSKTFVLWLALTLTIIIAWMADAMAYKMNAEWKNYKEFNNVRANLDDYGILDYETHKEVYEQIGLNSTDVRLLSTWHSADSEVFSIENLKEISQNKPSKDYSFVNIRQCLKETYEYVVKDNYLFEVIVMLTLVCGLVVPKKLLLLIPNFLLLIAELSYLVWQRRYPERATLLVFLYAFSVIIYAFPKLKEVNRMMNCLTVIVLLVLIVVGLYDNCCWKMLEESNVKEYTHKEEYRQFLSDISEHQENLYVWDIFAIERVLQGAYTPYEAFDTGVLSNSVYTGGWFVNTPIMANNAERFGEKNNPYKLLANSENVFWVALESTDINETLGYIRRHYNENAEIKCIAELSGISVYSFSE